MIWMTCLIDLKIANAARVGNIVYNNCLFEREERITQTLFQISRCCFILSGLKD